MMADILERLAEDYGFSSVGEMLRSVACIACAALPLYALLVVLWEVL